MPPCCVVPKCSNRTSGHTSPKDPVTRKAWLVAIKRDKFVPSAYSRVCKGHFKEDDYVLPKDSVRAILKPMLRPGAVPSVFAWTLAPKEATLSRLERVKRRQGRHENKASSNDFCVSELDGTDQNLLEESAVSDKVIEVDLNFEREVCMKSDDIESMNIESLAEETSLGSVPTGSDTELFESEDQALMLKEPCVHAMRIADYKDNLMKEELHFYTGFVSYDHFMFFFHLLGPAVYELNYYSSYSYNSNNSMRNLLSPEDQFFFNVVKFRRFTLIKELSYRFRITEHQVSNFVIAWINFLYCQLQEIDTWASPKDLCKLMTLKGKQCDAICIIDCTEIKIVQPKNPISQQQTYYHYKSFHTVKVFVAMTPTGAVSFVSEAYGGSISDRELTEKCGFLDKLTKDDVVLADRGFNIQDLLAAKNVKIKVPDFLPTKGQLKPSQTKRSSKIPSKCIHIERIIGLAKTYNILKWSLSSSLVPFASRIVFVCFMLANFRCNIVM